jgi:hypothetical protein
MEGRWSVSSDVRKPEIRSTKLETNPESEIQVSATTVSARVLMLLVTGMAPMLSGCGGTDEGPPRATVRGTVTLDDAPLKQGVIRFVPTGETEGPKSSLPIVNGRFKADEDAGPLVGSHRVEIESTDDGGYPLNDEAGLERLLANPHRLQVVRVPRSYNQRSTLSAQIVADGPNELTFELVSR